MSRLSDLGKLAVACVAAGVVVAGAAFPVAGTIGLTSNKMADSLAGTSADLIKGDLPAITTVTDSSGKPMAWLYDQQRQVVASEQINPSMKLAIVSIEDRRFPEHKGVDWKGTARAFLTNASSGDVQQGASTLDQQLVKNYQFLVSAQNDAERRAAIETTPARKIKEIRMALTLDKELSKDAILTKYLNLVPFGNGAFGVQVAAQTYFGVDAKDLTVPQAAMLAGMVQSNSGFNPYTHPDETRERRDVVMDTMVETGGLTPADAARFKEEPLGVLPQPKTIPRGCITAGANGFFCDYVLAYLAKTGMSRDIVQKGGYTIKTTLDQKVQDSVQDSLDTYGQPHATGVAEVMSVVRPGQDSHKVVAVASSRPYGLDPANDETVQPQPFSMVGDGAGSVFKIFTTAAAMEKGLGVNSYLSVPSRLEIEGFGAGGAAGCTPGLYCVQNAGVYPSSMSVSDALAQSPNTAFVNLIKDIGVSPVVDMAVRLGLRSYADKGSAPTGDSLANVVKADNSGSFTLGPNAVNALELSNVGATLSSHGMWCPPSPIESITDRSGKPVSVNNASCQQVVAPGLADSLANAMSKDDKGSGTSARAAGLSGWSLPVSGKTGTTETHRSSAFLGFTNTMAAATYAYNDGPQTSDLCTSPLRQCGWGDLFGGNEPAQTWYTAMRPIADTYGPVSMAQPDPEYMAGKKSSGVPSVQGMSQSAATSALVAAGYQVQVRMVSGGGAPYGEVIAVDSGTGIPGSTVTLRVSDGDGATGSAAAGAGADTSGGNTGPGAGTGDEPQVITVPGLPPVTISPPR